MVPMEYSFICLPEMVLSGFSQWGKSLSMQFSGTQANGRPAILKLGIPIYSGYHHSSSLEGVKSMEEGTCEALGSGAVCHLVLPFHLSKLSK